LLQGVLAAPARRLPYRVKELENLPGLRIEITLDSIEILDPTTFGPAWPGKQKFADIRLVDIDAISSLTSRRKS
jgi:hypothetical protein